MSDTEAIGRLGVRLLSCKQCAEQFAYRNTRLFEALIFVDGEMVHDGNDYLFCDEPCAKRWVRSYNASPERRDEDVFREAVYSPYVEAT